MTMAPENSPEERRTCNRTVSTRRKVNKQAAQVHRQTRTRKSTGGQWEESTGGHWEQSTGRHWEESTGGPGGCDILHLGENMPTHTWVLAWDNEGSSEMMAKLKTQNTLFYLGGLQIQTNLNPQPWQTISAAQHILLWPQALQILKCVCASGGI